MNFLAPLFQDPFLQVALIASFLASIASGTIGSFVVIKRISFIAGAIAHSVLGGMGLFLWLNRSFHLPWLDPLIGAFLSAVGSALLLGWIHLNYKQREDGIIAAIWSTGMAIGVIFISFTPGTNVELMSFLFGNILCISSQDLLFLALLDGLIFLTLFVYYRRFVSLCIDEEQAYLRGIPVQKLYLLLLSLVAISIVLLIQLIGTILVIALLTIPPMLSSIFTHKLSTMIFCSIALSFAFSALGLALSYQLDWPPGSTIALLAALIYFISLVAKNRLIYVPRRGRRPLHGDRPPL